MTPIVLGLDIGGANLKAATVDKRAVSVPFALWKQPDKLPAALAELMGQFPDAEELAVTMTGELCDCYETKREGVDAILDAVEFVANWRPVRVWSTDGAFVTVEESRASHMKVAAANWHALATFAGRYAPKGGAILIDIGSTTTDIIPLNNGSPCHFCSTDRDRLLKGELVYIGVRRTPVCALHLNNVCAELFATTQDAHVVLGLLPEDPSNRETANGRPSTISNSRSRLARMLGGDTEMLSEDELLTFASHIHRRVIDSIAVEVRNAIVRLEDSAEIRTLITSGAGVFVAKEIVSQTKVERVVSLNYELGPAASACAPACALAILATERRQ